MAEEQAVTVSFRYGQENLEALHSLEEELEVVLEKEDVGYLDGNEVSTDLSEGQLFMFGPDAERLYKAIHPILKAAPFMEGATATLGAGEDDDATEKTVEV